MKRLSLKQMLGVSGLLALGVTLACTTANNTGHPPVKGSGGAAGRLTGGTAGTSDGGKAGAAIGTGGDSGKAGDPGSGGDTGVGGAGGSDNGYASCSAEGDACPDCCDTVADSLAGSQPSCVDQWYDAFSDQMCKLCATECAAYCKSRDEEDIVDDCDTCSDTDAIYEGTDAAIAANCSGYTNCWNTCPQ